MGLLLVSGSESTGSITDKSRPGPNVFTMYSTYLVLHTVRTLQTTAACSGQLCYDRPGATGADGRDTGLTWLCGLTEEMEPFKFKPPSQPSRATIDPPGANGQESTNLARSKRGRHSLRAPQHPSFITIWDSDLANRRLHSRRACPFIPAGPVHLFPQV